MDERALLRMVKSFFNFRAGRTSFENMHKRVVAGARIDGIHVCQLIAAMIIASIGLNVDSTEAIVGAMLICPLMGSVLAISYAVATVDRRLLRGALLGLTVQFLVCLFTSTVYFVLSPLGGQTEAVLTNSTPTIWDVIIALVGGFAGALGMSRQQEPATLIAGVAVATSLMPPLCATGYGLAARDIALAGSAVYEFLVNVVFIAFGSEMMFVLLRVPILRDLNGDGVVTPEEELEAAERSHELRMRLVLGSLVFAIPCVFFSVQMVRAQMAETGTVFEVHDTYETELTTRELAVLYPQVEAYRIGTEDSYDTEDGMLVQRVVATVETSGQLTEDERAAIEGLIRLHVEDLDEVTFEEPEASGEAADELPADAGEASVEGQQDIASADAEEGDAADATADAAA